MFAWVGLASLCGATVASAQSPLPKPEAARIANVQKYHYINVALGAAEPAGGLAVSAKNPSIVYMRGESGGAWKLDLNSGLWTCITDTVPFAWRDLLNVDAMAVDPRNPEVLYLAGGVRWGDDYDIIKTEDGGKTWRRLNVRNSAGRAVANDASGELREAGERLTIDANDPNVILYATRNDGLLISRDAGTSWRGVESFSERGKPWVGLSFVAGDFSSSKQGEPTKRWYVGVVPDRNRGVRGGIFATEDGGQSWYRLEAGPGLLSATSTPMRAVVAADGTTYVTTIGGGVWRGKAGDWMNITPAEGRSKGFCAVALDPRDPSRVLVAQAGTLGVQAFYYSDNAGSSWRRYAYSPERPAESNVTLDDLPAWMSAEGRPNWGAGTAAIAFDPMDPTRAMHLSSSGVYSITGLGAATVTAKPAGHGREQSSCAVLISPTAGAALLSGSPDAGGFRHESLSSPPSRRFVRVDATGASSLNGAAKTYQDVLDIDVQPASPNRIVMVGGWQSSQTGEAAFSIDNGKTFRGFPSRPFPGARFGRIAQGVDADNVVWVPQGNASTCVYFTTDNGKTWFPSDGAPLGLISSQSDWTAYRCLAADRVKAGTFYIYDRRDGHFYRSEDGGASFSDLAQLPRQAGIHSDWHRLESAPFREGDVWLALREQGLLHSSDGGTHWSRVAEVAWAENLTFGKPGETGAYPAIYLVGRIGAGTPQGSKVEGELYRSDDAGKTWTQLTDDTMRLGLIAPGFAGDMQTPGRVFIGTKARGILVAEP